MKKLTNLLFFLLASFFCFSQETQYKEYSYSEFFKMIEETQDSVFRLSDAVLLLNPKTDSLFFTDKSGLGDLLYRKDTIYINKRLVLNNVHSLFNFKEKETAVFGQLNFNGKVTFTNCSGFYITQCNFNKKVDFTIDENMNFYTKNLKRLYTYPYSNTNNQFSFMLCNFRGGINYNNSSEDYTDLQFGIISSHIWSNQKRPNGSGFRYKNQTNFWLTNNTFYGEGEISISIEKGKMLDIDKNSFKNQTVLLNLKELDVKDVNISNNQFTNTVFIQIPPLNQGYDMPWEQFSNKLIDDDKFSIYYVYKIFGMNEEDSFQPDDYLFTKRNIDYYQNTLRTENQELFAAEMRLRGNFYNLYQQQHDTYSANMVYREMKDLETQRFAFLYHKNPSFDTFFQWKINQFLKAFSVYGTKPSRAMVISLYVILAFALIYLFFPNSWDQHGRKRIMDRYTFFMKYMKKDAGIHEVYLEEKQPELMQYETFKTLVTDSKEQVPKFFIVTGLPLYKWAISGTKLHAAFLSKVDIMKGTWQDLPKGKRFWKALLLIVTFLLAIVYDLCIKVLNALMLSINTFTTLGFGEIPIKGLPRYLAIIQGFIGWFMLTIFSVSLISQLLN